MFYAHSINLLILLMLLIFKEKNAPSKILGSREARQQCESEEEGECEEATTHHLTEATTSATEWMGVTTNSDDCSYR